METTNSQRMIGEAIKKIALGRSIDRVNMSLSGMGGVVETEELDPQSNDSPDYDELEKTGYIENPFISFVSSTLLSKGEMIFGQSKETGLYLSPTAIRLKDKSVYHEGNANLTFWKAFSSVWCGVWE